MTTNILNSDTLKTVVDSISTSSAEMQSKFGEITFAPERILEYDGLFISIVGYAIVFIGLLSLYAIFYNISKLLIARQRKKLKEIGHRAAEHNDITVSGEISAAISMALYLHFEEAHDFENTVLTIKKVQRTYSPWSSKLYGLTQVPRR